LFGGGVGTDGGAATGVAVVGAAAEAAMVDAAFAAVGVSGGV
jgi:hypothetical protein